MDLLERAERLEELRNEIDVRRAETHDKTEDGTLTVKRAAELSSEVEDLLTQQSTLIVDGAKPCPHCGELPHGIAQSVGVKGEVRHFYEVGCLTPEREPKTNGETDKGHPQTRAIDVVPELAVARWNRGKFEPKSSGPGVKLDDG